MNTERLMYLLIFLHSVSNTFSCLRYCHLMTVESLLAVTSTNGRFQGVKYIKVNKETLTTPMPSFSCLYF